MSMRSPSSTARQVTGRQRPHAWHMQGASYSQGVACILCCSAADLCTVSIGRMDGDRTTIYGALLAPYIVLGEGSVLQHRACGRQHKLASACACSKRRCCSWGNGSRRRQTRSTCGMRSGRLVCRRRIFWPQLPARRSTCTAGLSRSSRGRRG